MPLLTNTERIGTVLGGRYRITGVVAHGGMGTVFSAHCLTSGTEVVCKLPQSLAPEALVLKQRFKLEAKLNAALIHPNIVQVFDQGESEDGLPFIVLERLHGHTLAVELTGAGPLSPHQALKLLWPILGALNYAHGRGIVHRDIKPSNIFLHQDRAGTIPKLLDFGLANEVDAGRLTATGLVVGTPSYMAPERRQGAQGATPAADIWSLCAVIYDCIQGSAYADSRPLPAPSTTAYSALSHAVARGLHCTPEARYAHTTELAEALVQACRLDGIPLPVDPDPTGLPQWRTWLTDGEATEATCRANPPAPSRPVYTSKSHELPFLTILLAAPLLTPDHPNTIADHRQAAVTTAPLHITTRSKPATTLQALARPTKSAAPRLPASSSQPPYPTREHLRPLDGGTNEPTAAPPKPHNKPHNKPQKPLPPRPQAPDQPATATAQQTQSDRLPKLRTQFGPLPTLRPQW